jgi:hypothetical protein
MGYFCRAALVYSTKAHLVQLVRIAVADSPAHSFGQKLGAFLEILVEYLRIRCDSFAA